MPGYAIKSNNRLRRGHPKAAGLVGAWHWPGSRGPFGGGEDLAGCSHATTPVNVVTFDRQRGLITTTPGTGTTTAMQGAAHSSLRLNYPITVVWAGAYIASPDSFAAIFGMGYDNAGGSPYIAYGFGYTVIGAVQAAFNNPANQNLNWSQGFNPGKQWLATTLASGSQKFYVNDPVTAVATASVAGAITYGTGPRIYFGGQSDSAFASRRAGVSHEYALVYNRILSARELAWGYRQGVDLFARPRGRVGWVAALQGAQVVAGNPAALLPAM